VSEEQVKKARKRVRPRAFSVSKSSNESKAFESLTRLLAKRDHSELELKQKLSRFYEASAVAAALTKAADYNYLKNPEELSLVLSRGLHRKKKGFAKIKHELQRKGLPVVETPDLELEFEKAMSHVDKLSRMRDDLSLNEVAKILRALAQRGFDMETLTVVRRELGKRMKT
jgi:regulatory protein